jgi:hypothetical protein
MMATKINARRSVIWEKDHEVVELERMLKDIEEWISPLKQSLEDGAEFVFSEHPERKALQYELLEMRHYTRVAVGWLEELELTLIKKIKDKKRRDLEEKTNSGSAVRRARTPSGPRKCKMASIWCGEDHHLTLFPLTSNKSDLDCYSGK